jgi:hypothetical protein
MFNLRMLLLFLFSFMWLGRSYAAREVLDGTRPGFWAKRSVVLAVAGESSMLSPHSIDLSILATLTGPFDAARYPDKITARISYDDNSAITGPPAIGSQLVVLIHERDDGATVVTGDVITFFPSHSAIVQVDDLYDPVVKKIMAELRGLRAKKPSQDK